MAGVHIGEGAVFRASAVALLDGYASTAARVAVVGGSFAFEALRRSDKAGDTVRWHAGVAAVRRVGALAFVVDAHTRLIGVA